MAEPLDRFRSFLERYVIARAGHFEVGREQEQAWLAIQDAKKIYGMAKEASNETDPAPDLGALVGQASQAPVTPAWAPAQTTAALPWPPTGKASNAARNATKVPPAVAGPGLLQRIYPWKGR